MTTVNWERESGERIEEFVAALLLLKYPHGNQVTPSKGDRGVDVRVWHPDGYDIYQVKRFARPLTATQKTQVEKSWQRFSTETLPSTPVRSWTLVTPWEPTPERLEWLEELTEGGGIPIHWMGGRILDGMAAENPALVDYFFGDGGERLHRLMADALQGGQAVPKDVAGEDLLSAAITRHRALATTLNKVDPFYRYDLQVRSGQVKDLPWDTDLHQGEPAAFLHYEQLDDDSYLILKLIPRSAESARLRPITLSTELIVPPGSAERQAIDIWERYGRPFTDVPAIITDVTGPPGLSRTGAGRIGFYVAVADGQLPDLEVRLTTNDGTAISLDLHQPRIASGTDGTWIAGTDRSGTLDFEFLLNGPRDEHDRISLSLSSPTGKTPAEVLPALRLLAELPHADELVLAVRDGRPLTAPWESDRGPAFADSPMIVMAKQTIAILEALQAIQRHTFQRVIIPPLEEMHARQVRQLVFLGRLLQGEHIEVSWTELVMTATTDSATPFPGTAEFAVRTVKEIHLNLPGQNISLDSVRQVTHYHTVRLEDSAPTSPGAIPYESGTTIRLVPGASSAAVVAITAVQDT